MIITYCIDNKLGGVTSLNYNLIANSTNPATKQQVIHIDLVESQMTRANLKFPVDQQQTLIFSENENYYSVVEKLRRLIPDQEGVLVLNYDTEMAMLDHYPVKQTTYQLVHDEYNIGLARKFEHVVDVFICHNTVIYDELSQLLPHRRKNIVYLPHGVPVPATHRQAKSAGPLKLVFLGRMTAAKGIFDLPVISEMLRKAAIEFEWICIGNGPELDALKHAWNPLDKVLFASPPSAAEVTALCATGDIFVLPTKFEGSPVSLIETMSVGLVPVVSAIPGGITDIVKSDIGYAVAVDDNEGFANAIVALYQNRSRLNTLSINCRNKIIEAFDVKSTAKRYHDVFDRYAEFHRVKTLKKQKLGSRLDHPSFPSFMTRFFRRIIRK
jgi:glycosyltransferase involved in cell wall biosynthesis